MRFASTALPFTTVATTATTTNYYATTTSSTTYTKGNRDIYLVVKPPPLVEIAVDANRDGTIAFSSSGDTSDVTSSGTPYRFWLNNDYDTGVPGSDIEASNKNSDYFYIISQRDLEDFTQLSIKLEKRSADLLKQGGKLSIETTAGLEIKVFRAKEAGKGYLTNKDKALAQVTLNQSDADRKCVDLTDITKNIPQDKIGTDPLPFLFEGVTKGNGIIRLVLKDGSGKQVSKSEVYLKLLDVKEMYEQYQATPTSITPPFTSLVDKPFDSSQVSYRPMPNRPQFDKPPDEVQKAFVFVNGSNEKYWYSTTAAETMFKRLWWQGYKGRFVSFRWETLLGPNDGYVPAHYNLNEWLGWNWGKGLKDFVANGLPAGYTKNVGAHSLGCTVVASALKQGMSANNVILLQGAISAGCFDASGGQSDPNSLNGFIDMWAKEALKPTPDFATQWGYRGYVTNQGGSKIYSFYNDNDYALASGAIFPLGKKNWEVNQEDYKPDYNNNLYAALYQGQYIWQDWVYSFSSTAPFDMQVKFTFPGGGRRFVTTQYEAMAFTARSRSKALGAKAGVGGIILNNVNIGSGSETALGGERSDHSGEFNRPIQILQPFYQTLSDLVK